MSASYSDAVPSTIAHFEKALPISTSFPANLYSTNASSMLYSTPSGGGARIVSSRSRNHSVSCCTRTSETISTFLLTSAKLPTLKWADSLGQRLLELLHELLCPLLNPLPHGHSERPRLASLVLIPLTRFPNVQLVRLYPHALNDAFGSAVE